MIAAGVRSFAAQAAAREAELGFGLFAANPNLRDGQPWLSAGAGNLLTGTSLDTAGVSAAPDALRNQLIEGGTKCDADAAHIVVNGADELAALEIMDTLRYADPPPVVIPSAHVPASSWFVLASPKDFPVVLRTTMAGSTDSVWAENPREQRIDIDGFGIRLNHTPLVTAR